MMHRLFLSAAVLMLLSSFVVAGEKDKDGWVSLFDGKSFKGWKINENKKTWSIENGAIKCNGPRSHMFYVGDKEPFVNFEFMAEVMTTKGSNAGIFFHTKYQESGWPQIGYESQVNISHGDPQKTGTLYNTVKVANPPAEDNKWWTHHIIVKGKHIITKINGKTVVDYIEPEGKKGTVKLGKGTFALQAHDPGSTAYFKNIKVKRLP